MSESSEFYAFSLDLERFHGRYDTRELALATGRAGCPHGLLWTASITGDPETGPPVINRPSIECHAPDPARITLTVAEFREAVKAQGVPREHFAVICPACGTTQSASDFIAAGVAADFKAANKYLGYSCVGRFTHRLEPPLRKDMGTQAGCNWTLGGLLRIHELEVIDEEGKHHPHFALACPEQARAHMARHSQSAPSHP